MTCVPCSTPWSKKREATLYESADRGDRHGHGDREVSLLCRAGRFPRRELLETDSGRPWWRDRFPARRATGWPLVRSKFLGLHSLVKEILKVRALFARSGESGGSVGCLGFFLSRQTRCKPRSIPHSAAMISIDDVKKEVADLASIHAARASGRDD